MMPNRSRGLRLFALVLLAFQSSSAVDLVISGRMFVGIRAAASAPAQERFSFFHASTPENVQRMLTRAGLRDDDVVVDLGSGDGLIPLTAARMNRQLRGGGVGIGPELAG